MFRIWLDVVVVVILFAPDTLQQQQPQQQPHQQQNQQPQQQQQLQQQPHKHQQQQSQPQNTVVTTGDNLTLYCQKQPGDVIWYKAGYGHEPIYVGKFLIEEFRTRYSIQENNIMVKDVEYEDADMFTCVKNGTVKHQHYNAYVIVSDPARMKCGRSDEGDKDEVIVGWDTEVTLWCSLTYKVHKDCTAHATWQNNASLQESPGVKKGNIFLLIVAYNSHQTVYNSSHYKFSIKFKCQATDAQQIYADNKPSLLNIYTSPTFIFVPRFKSPSFVTSAPVLTFNFKKSGMMITLIVLSVIVVFLLFIFLLIFIKRKFFFTQQQSLGDYIRTDSGLQSSSNYTTPNVIMTDNVAFKRQASSRENSYNLNNHNNPHNPNIHSNSNIHPNNNFNSNIHSNNNFNPNTHVNNLTFNHAYRLQSHFLSPATPETSQTTCHPLHLPYTPLIHQPLHHNSQDFYDTIPDVSLPQSPLSPSFSTLPRTSLPHNLSNNLGVPTKQADRPVSIPCSEPPLPPLLDYPDDKNANLGVYLLPETN